MDPDLYQKAWQGQSAETRITVDAELLRKEVERNQRRAEGTRDEHRALPAAQEASNLKHQLPPSLRGTRRAVSIDAGRTG